MTNQTYTYSLTQLTENQSGISQTDIYSLVC